MKLDHIMYATPDLDEGIRHIRNLTGVEATFGGSHPGAGTRNALLSFGDEQYLEIIAPDPDQALSGNMGEEFAALDAPFIRTWAVAVDDYAALSAVLKEIGYGEHIIEMSRTRPDGVHLAWQILFVTGHPFDQAMPFFINWLESPHPATDAPGGCVLKSFHIQCPAGDELQHALSRIGLDVTVSTGPVEMTAVLDTPNGDVSLR